MNPDLALGDTRIAPIPRALVHEPLHGQLTMSERLYAPTLISFMTTQAQSFFNTKQAQYFMNSKIDTTNTDPSYWQALYAITRHYDLSSDVPAGLINLLINNANVATCIIQFDAIIRLNTEGKEVSPATNDTINDCLKALDLLILDSQKTKSIDEDLKSNFSFYQDLIINAQIMLSHLPIAFRGKILSTMRAELSLNPLGLTEDSSKEDMQLMQKKQSNFTVCVGFSVATATLGSSVAVAAGLLLLNSTLMNPTSAALLLALIVLVVVVTVSACSVKAEANHPRLWTLSKPDPSNTNSSNNTPGEELEENGETVRNSQ